MALIGSSLNRNYAGAGRPCRQRSRWSERALESPHVKRATACFLPHDIIAESAVIEDEVWRVASTCRTCDSMIGEPFNAIGFRVVELNLPNIAFSRSGWYGGWCALGIDVIGQWVDTGSGVYFTADKNGYPALGVIAWVDVVNLWRRPHYISHAILE